MGNVNSKLEKLRGFLLKLHTLSPYERSRYISTLNRVDFEKICEVFKNLLNSKLTQDTIVLRKIKKHARSIRKIADRRCIKADKVKFLTSVRGGYILNILLPIAIRLLATILK